MAGEPAFGRRKLQHEATKEEILEAAWGLARARGLAGFSLRDLAVAVQMRHQSLYTYFASKQAIYDAMFAQGMRALAGQRSALALDRDPIRALRQAARAFLAFCVEDPVRYQLLFERVVPGFVPSAASMELSAEALGYVEAWHRAAGLTDPADVDLWRAVLTGLAGQQIANDPGGARWTRLADRAIDGLLSTARPASRHRPPRAHPRSGGHGGEQMTRTRPADRGPGHQTPVMTAAESALADRRGPALAAAYQQTYAAIRAILNGLSDRQQMTVIPACPAWTVRDLAAHMTGVAADALTARFPVVNPHGPWAERQPVIDAFTCGQVTSRQGMTTGEVLAEWAGHVAVLAPMLRGEQAFPPGSIPIIDWMVVCDIAAHGQDLRGALHIPGDRDSAGVALSLQRYVAGLSQRIAAAGLPALRLCTERSEHIAGHGPPSAALTATEWELFRALSSRRSPSQIRSLRWSGDAGAYLPLLPAYGLPRTDLIE